MLYKINKKHEDWLAVRLAVSVMAKKEVIRSGIDAIKVADGIMEATNGHVAVIAQVSDIWEDGFYVPTLQNQSMAWLVNVNDIYDHKIVGEWPKLDKAFNVEGKKKIGYWEIEEKMPLVHDCMIMKVMKHGGVAIAYCYAKILPPGPYDVYCGKYNESVVFRGINITFAVMPFRLQ